ncbi:probable pinoresinol-lariciresinol reductase 3 isoform X2 [Miscanthus floridulus]|uniref:probable pinoresinol-lariciresinol reductase 3 isoform X2 n=1 Tax=Miscanthus floridulus TaxID=154761 RepID=UPI003459EB9E
MERAATAMSREAARTRSRVLVVGATGRLGGSIARASLAAGHPTFALVRPHHFARPDSPLLEPLVAAGATLLQGSLEDYSSLLEAVRQVDVVICAVPTKQVLEQKPLIRAIKEAGCVKRFIPAEFGADPTKVQICDMDYGFYEKKIEIRHSIESEGIPHTYICCNFFMRYLLPSLVQPGLDAPPRDKIKIFGEGNTKEDPRTLNKTLYLRPPGNVCSMNELADLWETKIKKSLKRLYVTEEQLLKEIHDAPFPLKMDLIFIYSAFVKGDHTYFEFDLSIEGTQLYPHVNYTTVIEYLDTLV